MSSPSKNQLFLSCQKIFRILTGIFYVVFTLAPDSHSLMVLYPFVSLWQIGLLFPVFWLLCLLWNRQASFLGNGFDWLMGLIVVSVALSTVRAIFPQQAIWYGWVALCFVTAIYGVNSCLKTPTARYRMLVKQGYLSLVFMIVSLTLWVKNTFLPELERINDAKQQGVVLNFDFSVLELRNWAPLGHQNYVAGYLLLCFPVLVWLIIVEPGKRRWLWVSTLFLGIIDLYTTSSRSGWLGLGVIIVIGLVGLVFLSSISRIWLFFGSIGSFLLLIGVILANNRFFELITGVINGESSGEIAYRTINIVLGYRMGMSQFLTGVGLGNVPLLYQKYRPFWAGGESELGFQLHSTPFHLWAELGILAVIGGLLVFVLLTLATIKLLRYQAKISFNDYLLGWCILASFLGYGVMSLTDYQLDNVCISGILIILTACLSNLIPSENKALPIKVKPQILSLISFGVAIAFMIWLFPVHRAWQLSSQGFIALSHNDFQLFRERLIQAHQIAPWEPYYSYQLGWNFGQIGRKTKDKAQQQALIAEAIQYFRKANEASPYREFGHSNLGWLLLNVNPQEATQEFAISAKLVPAKKGVFFGLGLSLLQQNKPDLAVEAFSLEILRDSSFLTSPFWRNPQLKPIYTQIIKNLEQTYNQWLQQEPNNIIWHRARGGVYWWQGKIDAASSDWQEYGTDLQQMMLAIASEEKIKAQLNTFADSAAKSLLNAWFNPSQRSELITKAWLQSQNIPLPETVLKQLTVTMAKSPNLETWLKYNVPVFPYYPKRMGFGVISRHIDGVTPSDYYLVRENLAIAKFLDRLYPDLRYTPNLDRKLQPRRKALFKQI
ncbi:O-antigen polymerase [Hyella patelloides LEGE 07179]|uniref:O-antigen polymerase n=1 Tax=Hyella patelloides LEGE 07179 TaxID=945734 RepID=A0A563W3N6_9CYAN|nr:O-antigen ligase family protein [Hyella patelloides]VEP18275.1 O-antigen polymerase [Hyella patelloides LEGE 07179]